MSRNFDQIKIGFLGAEQVEALTEAIDELAAASVFISDYKLAFARRLHAVREKLLTAFPEKKP